MSQMNTEAGDRQAETSPPPMARPSPTSAAEKDRRWCWCTEPRPTTAGGGRSCRLSSSISRLRHRPARSWRQRRRRRLRGGTGVRGRRRGGGLAGGAGEPAWPLLRGAVRLEAALLTRDVRKLVLYEPGIEVAGEEIYPPRRIDRLEALLEAGDRDGVVTTTMREVAGLPPEVVEYMRAQPRGRRGWTRHTRSRGSCEQSRPTGSIRRGSGYGGADAAAGRRRQPGCLSEGRGPWTRRCPTPASSSCLGRGTRRWTPGPTSSPPKSCVS